MKTQHTPGPWDLVCTPSSSFNDIRYLSGPDCEKIATVHCKAGEMGQKEALANAALIAAAPETAAERDHLKEVNAELLQALETIVKITDGSQPIDYPGALMVARAAIAKAKGE
jgi:hypothetical protein